MTNIEEIKEAIIKINDGSINIIFGANINKNNENFHDKVSLKFLGGATELFIKGRMLKSHNISGEITDEHPYFKNYCEKLQDFEKQIITTETKKFSWKTFRREVKTVRSVVNSYYRETRYIYKEEFWNDREYKTNNWVFTEFKG